MVEYYSVLYLFDSGQWDFFPTKVEIQHSNEIHYSKYSMPKKLAVASEIYIFQDLREEVQIFFFKFRAKLFQQSKFDIFDGLKFCNIP